jgi:hypothetical protein
MDVDKTEIVCTFRPKSAATRCVIPMILKALLAIFVSSCHYLDWSVLFFIVFAKSLGCCASTSRDAVVIDRRLVRPSDGNELAGAGKVRSVSSGVMARNWETWLSSPSVLKQVRCWSKERC